MPTDSRIALWFGVAVPFLYFGTQIAASPFYPGYSFITDAASLLGSDRSTFPVLFNLGAMGTGVAMIVSAYGFVRTLPDAGGWRIVAWLLGLALVSAGLGSVCAGWFPLPSPQHAIGAAGSGIFLLPLLFLTAFWRVRGAATTRGYFIVNLLLFGAIAAVMSGAVGMNVAPWAGVMQRMIAAVVMIPIAVAAVHLIRKS
jgi:hypothetical membrane protein